MSERAIQRITAVAGFASVLLIVAGLATWGNPQYTDPIHLTNAYYVGHRREALLSVSIFLLLGIPILVFGAGVRTVVRRREGEGDLLSTLTFGGAVSCFVWLCVFGSVNAAIALAAGSSTPSETRLLLALEYNVDQLNFLVIGAFATAGALGMVVTRALPRWIGIAGTVGGLLLLVSNVSMLDPTGPIGNVSNLGMIGQFLFLFWVIAVSVVLIRRSLVSAGTVPAQARSERVPG